MAGPEAARLHTSTIVQYYSRSSPQSGSFQQGHRTSDTSADVATSPSCTTLIMDTPVWAIDADPAQKQGRVTKQLHQPHMPTRTQYPDDDDDDAAVDRDRACSSMPTCQRMPATTLCGEASRRTETCSAVADIVNGKNSLTLTASKQGHGVTRSQDTDPLGPVPDVENGDKTEFVLRSQCP